VKKRSAFAAFGAASLRYEEHRLAPLHSRLRLGPGR
jgi:hypothetical protein